MLFRILKWLFGVLGITARRQKMRRERYEFLKSKISERHFGGYAGLVLDFPDRKFDNQDLICFKSPMYYWVKNKDSHWCVFWDRNRLTTEIGTGAPLREGEVLLPDHPGRTKPSSTLDTIDEQQPLTLQQTSPLKEEEPHGELKTV